MKVKKAHDEMGYYELCVDIALFIHRFPSRLYLEAKVSMIEQ